MKLQQQQTGPEAPFNRAEAIDITAERRQSPGLPSAGRVIFTGGEPIVTRSDGKLAMPNTSYRY